MRTSAITPLIVSLAVSLAMLPARAQPVDAAPPPGPLDCRRPQAAFAAFVCARPALERRLRLLDQLLLDHLESAPPADRARLAAEIDRDLQALAVHCLGDRPRRTGRDHQGREVVVWPGGPLTEGGQEACAAEAMAEAIKRHGEAPLPPRPLPVDADAVRFSPPEPALDRELRRLLSPSDKETLSVGIVDLKGEGARQYIVRIEPAAFRRDANPCLYAGCTYAIVDRRQGSWRLLALPVQLFRRHEPWAIPRSGAGTWRDILLRDGRTRWTADSSGVYGPI
jgi:hypothetical protein